MQQPWFLFVCFIFVCFFFVGGKRVVRMVEINRLMTQEKPPLSGKRLLVCTRCILSKGKELEKVQFGSYFPVVKAALQRLKKHVLDYLEHSSLHKIVISNTAKGEIIKDTLEKLQISDLGQFKKKFSNGIKKYCRESQDAVLPLRIWFAFIITSKPQRLSSRIIICFKWVAHIWCQGPILYIPYQTVEPCTN